MFPSWLTQFVEHNNAAYFDTNIALSQSNFSSNSALNNYFEVASTVSINGVTYIAALEGKNVPIYGAQYHPQANLFEWTNANVAQDSVSQLASATVTNFIVNEARGNNNAFSSPNIEDSYLIYNFNFTFINADYPRVYFFSEQQ